MQVRQADAQLIAAEIFSAQTLWNWPSYRGDEDGEMQ